MHKFVLLAGIIFAGLAVGIGAFGAHGLEELLIANKRVATFETAVKYHFYHALALLFIGLLMYHIPQRLLGTAGVLMVIGIIIFSGSLYILSLTNMTWLGMITPFGGLAFIIAWGLCAWGVYREKSL